MGRVKRVMGGGEGGYGGGGVKGVCGAGEGGYGGGEGGLWGG